MFTKRYWKDLLERVISSTAGAALAGWTVGHDWRVIGGFSGLMAAYTALKCLAASQIGDRDSASLLHLNKSYRDGLQ